MELETVAESEYVADGVNAKSKLNVQQIDEFYHKMKKTVWKVEVHEKNMPKFICNGVCVIDGQYILTTYINTTTKKVSISSSEVEHLEVGRVYRLKSRGLSLLKIKGETRYNHVKFASETAIDVGVHLYSLSYLRNALSPMFLMGVCAFPSLSNTMCRNISQMSDTLYPSGLLDIRVIQVANLGCACEYKLEDGKMKNKESGFGFAAGRGSPVFDAIGHLVGITSFQCAGFDMVIPNENVQLILEMLIDEAKKETESSSSG